MNQESKADNLAQLILRNADSHPETPAQYMRMAEGGFKIRTYAGLRSEIEAFASGLLELGFKRGDHVLIISDNRPEWLVADMAVLGLGGADSPRGCDATAEEITFIAGQCGCALGIFENSKQYEKLGPAPDMKSAVLFAAANEAAKKRAAAAGQRLVDYAELCALGRKRAEARRLSGLENEFESEAAKGRRSDVATLIYTSGTTGKPKGAMLEHRSFLSQAEALLPETIPVREGQILLSVLPVWHVFERISQYMMMAGCGAIAYSKPIGTIMLADFQTLRPQWISSVPRIWEAVREGIYHEIKKHGKAAGALFDFFVAEGELYAYFKNRLLGRVPDFLPRSRFVEVVSSAIPFALLAPLRGLGYLLVFRKIQKKLGGRFIAGISGGGALQPAVDRFFDAVGIRILEGYGLTETAPVLAVRRLSKPKMGTVGPLMQGTEIRIMGEKGEPLGPGHKGQVYVRGPQVMRGYFKDPERTAAAIDSEGWFNTGDLGLMTRSGELAIRGRVKDTIVLRGGENVEPAPIEARLEESRFILQALVVGQDERCLGALIVPKEGAVTAWARDSNVPIVDYESLLRQPEIRELIGAEIAGLVSARSGFKPFERIYRFALLATPFEEGVEISAKLEVKRQTIAKTRAKEIAGLFKAEAGA